MWKPRLTRQLDRLTAWPVASQHVARRNALVASTALAARRRELRDVEEYLERHRVVREASGRARA